MVSRIRQDSFFLLTEVDAFVWVLVFTAGNLILITVLQPLLQGYSFIPVLGAVAFSVVEAGALAGIVTTLVSLVTLWYFTVPPVHSFRLPSAHDGFGLALFVGTALAIVKIYQRSNTASATPVSRFDGSLGQVLLDAAGVEARSSSGAAPLSGSPENPPQATPATCSVLIGHALSKIDSVFAKMAFLGLFRDLASGLYQSPDLAVAFGEEEVNQVLRDMHREELNNWLRLDREQRKKDIAIYLQGGRKIERSIASLLSDPSLHKLLFPDIIDLERLLLSSDLRSLLLPYVDPNS